NWGTDWQGVHLGLLFFDETLKSAYKAWLRYLFTTPTEHLGGKTLAEEPALGIFQVQNEDSLLFWTINNLPPGPKARMGKLFGDFAIEKYGSLDAAFEVWGTAFSEGDDLENGILGLANIWYLTGDAPPSESKRLSDLHQFWTELMYDFYAEIVDYVRNDLGCPVVTNATNWKTADTVLLNDSERYSYLPTEVMAVNRYFTGVHSGPNQGWAIISGDFYTNASVLIDKAFELPVNLKQVAGRPMMVTESTWVYPNEYGFEAPLLLASYMSLTGVDMYFWFSSGTDDFEIPRSANGYLAFSQAKWLCMTPDMAGQWPAAALAFRRGYIRQGQPVVQEHRALQSMWDRRSPVIAESPSFDPNRDSGNLPPESSVETGVTPWAFFVGPVQVTYNSSEANTRVAEDMDDYISDSGSGKIVRSNTGELELNTDAKLFRLDSPRVQGVVSHRPGQVSLSNVAVDSGNGGFAVTVVSLDGLPLAGSRKVLIQVGTHSRPTGWATAPETREISGTMMEGFVVNSVGSAPWAVQSADLNLAFAGMSIQSATTLDMNGMPREALALDQDIGTTRLQFPSDAMYVVLEGNGLDYQTWAASVAWDNPETDMLDLADPERDGIPNLMEYAFSGDPLVTDFHLL
ncbi:MAG: hypothetical protein KJT03_19310, partial [Verrucomicrobiae bacterium]|nr:hypothetical protein [Verrucomicrobiae bacterium]